MEGKRLIRSLSLKNILSFGSEGVEMELQPLNVLIGPNGSGKSNFIEAIRLLHATPGDLTKPISDGGGINEWLWKGKSVEPEACIVADVAYNEDQQEQVIRYVLVFTAMGQRLQITHERIEGDISKLEYPILKFYSYDDLEVSISAKTGAKDWVERLTDYTWEHRTLKRTELKINQSILSQRYDPDVYPVLAYLGNLFHNIRLFADIDMGRKAPVRQSQYADGESDFLVENASNLAMVLNDLRNKPVAKRAILEKLKQFNNRIEDFDVSVTFTTMMVTLEEKGLEQTIPAMRLSDGTLRYLCLLAILCHPSPPPLICIEEPELGMHPDIIPTLAELLIEASQRTQIIVTTHSDLLVSQFSRIPEAIIVCERDEGGTQMKRLDADKLKVWLEKYSLGDLWLKGQIGGTRW